MSYINISSAQSVHNRYIGANGFKGVDFTSSPAFVALDRFSDAKNVYKDYRNGLGACVETFPGYRECINVEPKDGEKSEIRLLYPFTFSNGNKYFLVTTETNIYFFNDKPPLTIGAKIDMNASHAFVFQDKLYVFLRSNGTYQTRIVCLDEDDCNKGFDLHEKDIAESAYVPITFRDGEPYEQKNLLTNEFIEEFVVQNIEHSNDIKEYVVSWEGLEIPDKKQPNRYWYRTEKDGEKTFLISLYRSEKGSATSDAIAKEAYFKIPGTINVYELGLTFQTYTPPNSTTENDYAFTADKLSPEISSSRISVTFYPKERVLEYSSILFDGSAITPPLTIGLIKDSDEYIKSITISQETKDGEVLTVGSKLVVRGKTEINAEYKDYPTFGDAFPEYKDGYYSAIAECTQVTFFDDRFFLTGNPKLPNVVFYSSRKLNGATTPEYFGNLNYFQVGLPSYPIKALVSAADKLIALKDGGAIEPSLFCRSGVDTGENLVPRIYTNVSGIPGIGCVGAACNFLDDIVFASKSGIVGINKQSINLERSVGNRSSLINGRLLLEDMTQAVFAEWQGYLCVMFKNNGHMYLADSRQISGGEYEWYYIESLGSWREDYPKYTRKDGTILKKEELKAIIKREGGTYYTLSDDRTEEDAEPDGSMIGGEFFPASCIVSFDGCLYFGTGDGKVMIVNTDKRGVPSDTEKADETVIFDEKAYKAECGNLIRPEWYSFAGHEYESFVQTAYDDCGIPHLSKSTVSRSTVGDMKPMPGSRFYFKVYAADCNWSDLGASGNVIPDFSVWSFDTVSFQQDVHTISTVHERTRKWSRKMYRVVSGGFCQPFGIYKISYRYVVAGRIKQ
jgi:hypothetical protein